MVFKMIDNLSIVATTAGQETNLLLEDNVLSYRDHEKPYFTIRSLSVEFGTTGSCGTSRNKHSNDTPSWFCDVDCDSCANPSQTCSMKITDNKGDQGHKHLCPSTLKTCSTERISLVQERCL